MHRSRKKGFPDSSFAKEKGLKNNWNISAHYHTFNIRDSIVKINDSTFIYKGIPLFITITKNHWKIDAKNNDSWNFDIILTDGLPTRIMHNGKITTYRYLTYDSFDNWIKREIIDENGKSMIQVREIVYSVSYAEETDGIIGVVPNATELEYAFPKEEAVLMNLLAYVHNVVAKSLNSNVNFAIFKTYHYIKNREINKL